MDWAGIEEIVYAEAVHPERLLGATNAGLNTLIQAYFPGAKSVSLRIDAKKGVNKDSIAEKIKDKIIDSAEEITMEMQDEAGYFAGIIKGKNRHDYSYYVTYEDENKEPKLFKEVYGDYEVLSEEDIDKIMSGSCKDVYNKLGSHITTINGIKGTSFAVWAPNAYRVSVVGDFNDWDGRIHQMIRDERSGIFTLFVPDVNAGNKYKYEILIKGGEKIHRIDPYSRKSEEGDGDASVVATEQNYKWTDSKWMVAKSNSGSKMNVYEICVEAYGEDATYKSITDEVLHHVKEYGYNYVEIMPIMYGHNDILGYKPSSLFALNETTGSYQDICYFVDTMHANGIGVIMEFQCNSFEESESGIGYYDGTCLYEHEDPRKGIDSLTGAKIYQFGNKMVDQMVLSAGLYWVNKLHLDGIKMMDMAAMLYLDYYRNEWIPNMYGDNENLEAISFIKRFNKNVHKLDAGIITIADDTLLWPYVSWTDDMSEADKEKCLGFDYVINKGFNNDVISYMETDPIERAAKHSDLIVSTLYQYKEKYILSVSHSDVDFGKGGLVTRMPGNWQDKFANLRAFYGYLMTHPGNKQIFMGQDEAWKESFDGVSVIGTATDDISKQFASYIKDLMNYCNKNKALYELDFCEKGFEWINNNSANENVISFMRKDSEGNELLVVLNFANVTYAKYKMGVPKMGKYKITFTSDSKAYGGTGIMTTKSTATKEEKCDGFDNSVTLKLAPLSFSVYTYEAYTEAELTEMERIRKERENAILEAKRKREALAKEKARIKASLKEELARKIREAEAAIEAGSELVSKNSGTTKKKSIKDHIKGIKKK